MKKTWTITLACTMAFGMLSSTAWADAGGNHGNEGGGRQAQNWTNPASGSQNSGDEVHSTVTSDTYGNQGGSSGHQGYRGLLNAWLQVQGKPSQQVIEQQLDQNYNLSDMVDLLKQQLNGGTATTDASGSTASTGTSDSTSTGTSGTTGTADASSTTQTLTKAQIKAIAEQLKAEIHAGSSQDAQQLSALSNLSDVLASSGSLSDAVSVQEDVVAGAPADMTGYIKLSKLLKEQGHHGILAYVDGSTLASDVPPMIKDGVTLVPFRAIAEALKAQVSWDASTQTVTVVKNGITVKLTIGSNIAYVNGQPVQLDVPAQTTQSRTVIPVRFVSEALKAKVNWDSATQSVVILDPSQVSAAGTASGSTSSTASGSATAATGTGTTDSTASTNTGSATSTTN